MSNVDSPDAIMAATALGRLEKLFADEYVIAFGPNGRQLFATPNGYSAVQLPMQVLRDTLSTRVRRITWASFGSHPDSWFFAYEMHDNTASFCVGSAIPAALRQFIERISPANDLCSALRVQLGSNDSFVAWAKTSWTCHGVPKALEAELCQSSWTHVRSATATRGSIKGTLNQVAFHCNGSYYLECQEGYFWNLESKVIREAWGNFWLSKKSSLGLEELSELVMVALDPHCPAGETFAFIKKQHDAQEAPFAIHFHQVDTRTTETPQNLPEAQGMVLQRTQQQQEKPKFFRWAISKRDGRPHQRDYWELELKKGQKIKVGDDLGRNWFSAEGPGGVNGWVHGTWFEFCGGKVHQDAQGTYTRFQEDMRKVLLPGQLREFPAMREYLTACANPACQSLMSGSQLGVCVHNLQALLSGSGRYSSAWLKEERNVWHPDKFARYCHPTHKERLKASAQEMFVLYGVLMDNCS